LGFLHISVIDKLISDELNLVVTGLRLPDRNFCDALFECQLRISRVSARDCLPCFICPVGHLGDRLFTVRVFIEQRIPAHNPVMEGSSEEKGEIRQGEVSHLREVLWTSVVHQISEGIKSACFRFLDL
jgi:hypothetical protein